jgi:hypothetical protein
MRDLTPDSRLRVAALLQRIMHGDAHSFAAADADALWRELARLRLPALGHLAVGGWRLRRHRRWLRWVVEVEETGAARRGQAVMRLRYSLFGEPRDLLRLRGRVLDLRLWPGITLGLVLGPFRPWKRAAA